MNRRQTKILSSQKIMFRWVSTLALLMLLAAGLAVPPPSQGATHPHACQGADPPVQIRLPLAIDANYHWHTFYGSANTDWGWGIAVDGSGNIYLVGRSNIPWNGDGNTPPLHGSSGNDDMVILSLTGTGAYRWHTFYGSSSERDEAWAVATDGDGNIYVTGNSQATWNGDGNTPPLHPFTGSDDITVLSLTSAGAYRWHTFYGGSNRDIGWGVAADGGSNVYVAAQSDLAWNGDGDELPLHPFTDSDDIAVLSLTSAGAYRWHTFYGSSGTDGGTDVVAAGGHVYVAGGSGATWSGDGAVAPLHPFTGSNDITVLKLDSAGTYQWHTFYGGSAIDVGHGIAAGSGNFYVVGYSQASWNGDGGAAPLHAYAGGYDVTVLALDASGDYGWHTFYGTTDGDEGWAIATNGSGNVYLTGHSGSSWNGDGGALPLHGHSGIDSLLVLSLTGAGAYQWHTFYGATPYGVYGEAIATDGDSRVNVGGYSFSPWNGDGNQPPLHPYSASNDLSVLQLPQSPDGLLRLYMPLIRR